MRRTSVNLDVERLEKARINTGRYISEVAKEAAVGPSAAYNAFRGGRCSLDVARRIVEVLGLDLADVIRRDLPPA